MADLLRYLNAGWLLDRAFHRFEIRPVLGVGFEWNMEHATDRGPRTGEPQWADLNFNSNVRMGPRSPSGTTLGMKADYTELTARPHRLQTPMRTTGNVSDA